MRSLEIQGHWILQQTSVTREQLAEAWEESARSAGDDLCDVLLRRGLISSDQAVGARAAALRSGELQETAAVSDPRDRRLLDERRAGSGRSRCGPDEIGGYTIQRELGRGAMGVVYEGRHRETGRRVAMKFMLTTDPTLRRRFEREVGALLKVQHANVIRIVDAGESEGRPWFAMEFVKGTDLEAVLRENLRRTDATLECERIREIFAQLADALAHCHRQGVVHRDVKPANILIEEQTGRPILTDFGLMKSAGVGEASRALTATNEIIGTPAFMGPEQIEPKGRWGSPGPASDVWGLGMSMYFALTGRLPFNTTSMSVLLGEVLNAPIPAPSRSRADVPPELDELCLEALERDSAERISADELAERLAEAGAAPVARPSRVVPVAPRRRSPGLRRLPTAALAAGAGLVLILPLLWLLWSPAPELRLVESLPAITREPKLKVRGLVNLEGVRVRVNREEVVSRAGGVFEAIITLKEGENPIRVSVEGEPTVGAPLKVVLDTKPPRLELEALEDGFWVAHGEGTVRGRVQDSGAVEVFVRRLDPGTDRPASGPGERLEVGPAGHFRKAFESSPDDLAVRITARDEAGNTVRRDATVVSGGELRRRRRERKNRLRAVVRSVKAWRAANVDERERAARSLADQLGETFRFVGLRDAGGTTKECALFLHEPSEIELVLVPGGSLRGIHQSIELTLLELLSEGEISAEGFWPLSPMLSGRLLRGFRERLGWKNRLRELLERARSSPDDWRAFCEVARDLYKEINPRIPRTNIALESFLAARTELSRAQWSRLQGGPRAPRPPNPDMPVTNLSVNDVLRVLKSRSEGLRLPIRWEWRYMTHAHGGSLRFEWGDQPAAGRRRAWTSETSGGRVHSTREHLDQATPFGLSDLHGNLFELCAYRSRQDDPNYIGSPTGGDFKTPLVACRGGIWIPLKPTQSSDQVGIRLVVQVPGCRPPEWAVLPKDLR